MKKMLIGMILFFIAAAFISGMIRGKSEIKIDGFGKIGEKINERMSVNGLLDLFGIDANQMLNKVGVSESDLPFSPDENIFSAAGKSSGYIKDTLQDTIQIFTDADVLGDGCMMPRIATPKPIT